MSAAPLLEVHALSKRFEVSRPWTERWFARRPRQFIDAVDDVSFSIERGTTLALVGESGCGKSTLAKLLVGLAAPSAGSVRFDGHAVQAGGPAFDAVRGRVQMVFQNPYASLNPRWRVGDIVVEPSIEQHPQARAHARPETAAALLQAVGLEPGDAHRYPHQFSGGQRQRISIARALASRPEFIVWDEPTSALDVSVQAQVLNLMKDLQRERGLTYLFISHNLAVVRHVSDRVGVMYLGQLVELADRRRLFARPRHPYTRMLIDAVPDLRMSGRPRQPVQGEVANPIDPPSGCRFHPRCAFANARCRQERPALLGDGASAVACHAVEEGRLPDQRGDEAPDAGA